MPRHRDCRREDEKGAECYSSEDYTKKMLLEAQAKAEIRWKHLGARDRICSGCELPLRSRKDVRFSMTCDHFFCRRCCDDKEEREPQEYEVEREPILGNSDEDESGDKADDPYKKGSKF